MRYFFHLGYLGTNYSGWQKHPDANNIQQVLENALTKILKTEIWIVGCGRTDAKVHASQFFFHSDIAEPWDYDLLFRLNKALPDDIAVFDVFPMEGLPHARFDAIQRSYNYYIHTYKDPFLSNFSSLYLIKDWDLEQMIRAANLLLTYNDYHAFCKIPDRNTHTICHVSAANIFMDHTGDKLRFTISSNRFLGKMVRIIIDKLIQIGTRRLSIDEFENHLIHPKLPQIIKPAFPQGLYLSKIKYPYLDIPARSNFSEMLGAQTNTWKSV